MSQVDKTLFLMIDIDKSDRLCFSLAPRTLHRVGLHHASRGFGNPRRPRQEPCRPRVGKLSTGLACRLGWLVLDWLGHGSWCSSTSSSSCRHRVEWPCRLGLLGWLFLDKPESGLRPSSILTKSPRDRLGLVEDGSL